LAYSRTNDSALPPTTPHEKHLKNTTIAIYFERRIVIVVKGTKTGGSCSIGSFGKLRNPITFNQ
jgi:hypothetical protein